MNIRLPLFLILSLLPFLLHARVLEVGPGRAMTLPSQAAAAAQDGDTIDIDAGSYADACRWSANDLLIRGIGGYAHVKDKTWGGKAIWVIQGDDTTIEWIEFSGATVPDKNGAGIRQEGTNLTVRHCNFHDNEDGILAGDDAQSRILIEYCEFARNGYGNGFSHNMYINHIAEFTIRYSYIHHAKIGHNIKSRAYRTFVLCNGITSGDGSTSREIDLPNGGLAVVAGNVIVHGSNTQNSNLIGYGQEGLSNPIHNLYVTHNTFITSRSAGTFVALTSASSDTVVVKNNLFAGRASMLGGNAQILDTAANLTAIDVADFHFADPAAFDYHPLAASPAVNRAVDVGAVNGIALLPPMTYVHPASATIRLLAGQADIGALEYLPPVAAASVTPAETFTVDGPWPNPSTSTAWLHVIAAPGTLLRASLHDVSGRCIAVRETEELSSGNALLQWDLRNVPSGVYYCRLAAGKQSAIRLIIHR